MQTFSDYCEAWSWLLSAFATTERGGRLFGKEEKYPGAVRSGGSTDKKRSMRGGCRLLSCMFTVVCKGFAWVCGRMVTVFDELHDYFRKELCSHGYLI